MTRGVISALVGLIVGIPSLRLKGLYLAIANMGFVFITEEVIKYMEWLTRGCGGWLVIKNYWKAFPFNLVEVKRVAWIRRWK